MVSVVVSSFCEGWCAFWFGALAVGEFGTLSYIVNIFAGREGDLVDS